MAKVMGLHSANSSLTISPRDDSESEDNSIGDSEMEEEASAQDASSNKKRPRSGRPMPQAIKRKLCAVAGLNWHERHLLPGIWDAVWAAGAKSEQRMVILSWWTTQVLPNTRARLPPQPPQEVYDAIMTGNLAPNLSSTKHKGVGPGMFLGATRSVVNAEHEVAEHLLQANMITLGDVTRTAAGRDTTRFRLTDSITRDNLDAFSVFLRFALGERCPFHIQVEAIVNGLVKQNDYDQREFEKWVGPQLFSRLTTAGFGYFSVMPSKQAMRQKNATPPVCFRDITNKIWLCQLFRDDKIHPWFTPPPSPPAANNQPHTAARNHRGGNRNNNNSHSSNNTRGNPRGRPNQPAEIQINADQPQVFRTFKDNFHRAAGRYATIKTICFAAGINQNDLVGPNMFNENDCMRWIISGRCNCGGQHRHRILPQANIANIHNKLSVGMQRMLDIPADYLHIPRNA